jgi:hypothetical protein
MANKLMLVGVATLVALATIPARAEEKTDKPMLNDTARHEELVGQNLDTRIDTWVVGVVSKLDAQGPKLTVAGHQMPYATAHAGMISDIATQTAGLDPAKRDAKEKEIRASWQDKLNKASLEKPGSDTNFNCGLPSTGNLVVLNESSALKLDFLRKDQAIASIPIKNSQEEAKMEPTKTTDQKQDNALGAFSQLKVGDLVYLGYDAGILSNDAFAIIKREPAK